MRMKLGYALSIVGLVLIASISLYGDLGHSDVYAVCRITMRDGKTLEGIVRIAAGGYEKALHANGFYYELNGRPYTVDLFSPDFRSIDMVTGQTTYDPEVSDRGTGFPADRGRLYYLRSIPTEQYFANAVEDTLNKRPGKSSDRIVLERTRTHRFLYVLSEYVPVFQSVVAYDHDEDLDTIAALPPEKRPATPPSLIHRPTNIPIAQIARFELLTKPSQKWLTAIADNNKRRTKKEEASGAEDWLMPVWFHEIQPGNELYNDYKKFTTWEY